MIDRNALRKQISRVAEVSFSRAGGKGGQNVNKVNAKVMAAVDLDDLALLPPEARDRIRAKLRHRLTRGGKLFVQAQDERARARNVDIAFARLADLILAASRTRKKRKKTRVPPGAREERLSAKKKKKEKKTLRRFDGADD